MLEINLSELSSGVVHLDSLFWDTVEVEGFSIETVSSVREDILEILEEEGEWRSSPTHQMYFIIRHLLDNYPLVSSTVILYIGELELRRIVTNVSGRFVTPPNKAENPTSEGVVTVSRVSRYQRNPVL